MAKIMTRTIEIMSERLNWWWSDWRIDWNNEGNA